MSESEYIRAKALGTITAAINTLRDLVPENLKGVMTKAEYRKAMSALMDWQDRLFKQL